MNNQSKLLQPDVGQNKFLKSAYQQADVNLRNKPSDAKDKIHHFEIMRLLNSVENVNIESNIRKSKEDDGLAMLMELAKVKKDRYHKSFLISLADNPNYWVPPSWAKEPKSACLNTFEHLQLQKGSGSFAGNLSLMRSRVSPM